MGESVADENCNSKYGEPLKYDPNFKGPIKDRGCTDIICFFLFLSFIAGWGVVAYFAFTNGSPEHLIHPTDSRGQICGRGALKDKPYLFFFDLTKCARPSVIATGCPTTQVCVHNCPNKTFSAYTALISGFLSSSFKNDLICNYGVDRNKDIRELLKNEECASYYIQSVSLAGRCIPKAFETAGHEILTQGKKVVSDGNNHTVTDKEVSEGSRYLALIINARQIGERIFQDVKAAWWMILIALIVAMVISFVWILLMRWIAGVMVLISIIAMLALLSFACYYSFAKYVDLKNVPGADASVTFTTNLDSYLALRDTWLAFGIISAVILAIVLLLLIFLRNRLRIAVSLLQQGSKAVGSMMFSLFFPLIPYLIQLIFFVFYGSVAIYIASAGKATYKVSNAAKGCCDKFVNGSVCDPIDFSAKYNTTGAICQFVEYAGDPNLFRAQIYNLFGLFWGLFFIVGVGQVTLAGAFASYYWAFDKKNDVPTFAISASFYRTLRFHCGSVAFGSLLLAIVKMIRVMLEYIDSKLKKYDNKFTKVLLCLCKCCFWCLEKFIKFINKNAYIMMAVYGKNFCTSAKNAFLLLMRNIVRVVVLDKVTDFLLFIGKMVVVGGTGVASFYFFSGRIPNFESYSPELNYYLVPVIAITVGSYLIASGFFSVYGMAVDTLFLCFLEDCERNDGSAEKPYYMPRDLMKILGKKNKFSDPN